MLIQSHLFMSQDTNGVHRCPSCDQLGEARYGGDGSVTCLMCGHVSQGVVPSARRRRPHAAGLAGGGLVQRDIVSRKSPLTDLSKVKPQLPDPKPSSLSSWPSYEEEVASAREEIVEEGGGKKTVRRRKRKTRLKLSRMIFLALWFTCIIFVLWVVRKQKRDHRIVLPKEEIEQAELDELEQQKRAEASGYVKRALPECAQVLSEFLEAPNAAVRAQHVRMGRDLAPEMAVHYGANPAFKTEEQWFFRQDNNLVLHENLRAIESAMIFGEEEEREVVFVREGHEWKLDWEFFVKHSTSPWHLFLSEVGPTKGTFRVYARLQEAAESEGAGKVRKLRFYPATKDRLARNRGGSPAVLVPELSESAERLLEIIERKAKQPLTGERTYQQSDPEDLYRVRVVLEWRDGADGERYLHLNKVLAGNWLGRGFEEFSDSDEEAETIL